MSLTHTIDHSRRRVTALAAGAIDLADLEAHWHAVLSEGGRGYSRLVDATGASPTFGTPEVRRMTDLIHSATAAGPLGPTAVIVSTDVGFGMVHMFGILVEPLCQIRPFRESVSAERWLAAFDAPGSAPSR